MTLEDRIRRLEDIEEIRRLRNMYHYFINERQPERFREIYTDDALLQFDKHMKIEGIDAIVRPAPGGVDMIFENVDGNVLHAGIMNTAQRGRIPLRGPTLDA